MSMNNRIELRVFAEDKKAIAAAAELESRVVSDFIRDAALTRAQRVTHRASDGDPFGPAAPGWE